MDIKKRKQYFLVVLTMCFLFASCDITNTHTPFNSKLTAEEHIANIMQRTEEKYAEQISKGEITSFQVYTLWSFAEQPEYFLVEFDNIGREINNPVFFTEIPSIWVENSETDVPIGKLYSFDGESDWLVALEENGAPKLLAKLYNIDDEIPEGAEYGVIDEQIVVFKNIKYTYLTGYIANGDQYYVHHYYPKDTKSPFREQGLLNEKKYRGYGDTFAIEKDGQIISIILNKVSDKSYEQGDVISESDYKYLTKDYRTGTKLY